MSGPTKIVIPSEDAMSAFGAQLAQQLAAGDTILLSGPIGAGKTHLARAVISTLLDQPEDIPSPTYTLVQTYVTTEVEIWHADLYRLADSSELVELGLDEAMKEAIVIIEWPDRLPAETLPDTAVSIDILPDGDTRALSVTAASENWRIFFERIAHV